MELSFCHKFKLSINSFIIATYNKTFDISIFTLTEFIKVSSNKMKTIIINYGLNIVFWYITADSDKFRETIM